MTKRMDGRHILITGGSGSIGRVAALRCANEGAIVSVIGRRKEALDEVCAATGGHSVIADLSDERQAFASVNEIAIRMQAIDGVVNCIGGADASQLDDLELARWQASLMSNLTIPYLVCRAALPHLRKSSNAAIVNVGSIAGILPGVNSAAFAAAKAGLIQFTKTIAAQLAPTIRANCVSPGAADTDKTYKRLIEPKSKGERQAFYERYASKRLARPEEIANVLLFLLSSEASYVTGSNYVVDGGRVYH